MEGRVGCASAVLAVCLQEATPLVAATAAQLSHRGRIVRCDPLVFVDSADREEYHRRMEEREMAIIAVCKSDG